MLDLSITVVSWNTQDLLEQCLKSIYQNVRHISLEVFVVDNGSKDKSVEMIREKFPQVRVLKNKTNLGFSRAANRGLRRSTGKYLMILNPDTIVLPNSFEKIVRFMDAHPDIGAVGCKLLNPDGSLQRSYFSRFPTLRTIFSQYFYLSQHFYLRHLFPKNWTLGKDPVYEQDYSGPVEVEHLNGSCIAVRDETIKQVGFLDEDYFLIFEEADWCYRIRKAGWKINYFPKASIIHYWGRSSNLLVNRGLINTYKSQRIFFRKHYGKFSVLLLTLIIVSGHSLELAKALIKNILYFGRNQSAKETLRLSFDIIKWQFCSEFQYREIRNKMKDQQVPKG